MMTLNNLWNLYNLLVYVYDWSWIFSRICWKLRSHPHPFENSTKYIAKLCASIKKLSLLNIKIGIPANWEIWANKLWSYMIIKIGNSNVVTEMRNKGVYFHLIICTDFPGWINKSWCLNAKFNDVYFWCGSAQSSSWDLCLGEYLKIKLIMSMTSWM